MSARCPSCGSVSHTPDCSAANRQAERARMDRDEVWATILALVLAVAMSLFALWAR